jgi:hypothetical protein
MKPIASWKGYKRIHNYTRQAMKKTKIDPASNLTNGRRRMLKLTGAALLAGATLPHTARATTKHDDENIIYTGGLVINTDNPQVILNVYFSVGAAGAGVGTVSDVLHPETNSHLSVERTSSHGNGIRFEGAISASNGAYPVGEAFVCNETVAGDFTVLTLQIGSALFSGNGFFVSGPRVISADAF